MSAPKLMHTKDYTLFDEHENNRFQHENPKLLESMKEWGFLCSSPIHVARNADKKFKVIRGHHRLAYARRLELPVYFIIDDTPISLDKIETPGQTWNAPDFAYSFASSGNKDCATVLKFQKDHHLPFGMALALLSGQSVVGGKQTKKLREGKFRIAGFEHANRVVHLTDRCREKGIMFATERAFVCALSLCLRVPQFDTAVFLHKIDTIPATLRKRGRLNEYLEELEAFYNYGIRKTIPLAFEARRLAKEREAHKVSKS